ncbi:MAG: hypothetical protein ACTH07_03025 [Microbacterium sp.]
MTYTYTGSPNGDAREPQREACRAAAREDGMPETGWVHDEACDRSGLSHVHGIARDDAIDAVRVGP